jgi:hypothetical protein
MVCRAVERKMGGINIHCSDFVGRDKSGSAFEGVLASLVKMAKPPELAILTRIQSNFEQASDHLLIEPSDAGNLISLLSLYRSALEDEIAPITDPFVQMRRDEQALDPADAKYGAGTGWRYYCVLDLERAFAIAVAESTAVALVW